MCTQHSIKNFRYLQRFWLAAGLVLLALNLMLPTAAQANGACGRTITADVVALDQAFYYNRLGAINANGMMYALARDVVVNATTPWHGTWWSTPPASRSAS
jgi:hypothetical protein